MEIVAIIMHLVNGSVVEASVSATDPKMLYKGEPVLMYYFKTKKGKLTS